MKIVLASNNNGKLKEFSTLLQPFNIEVFPPTKLGLKEIDETGLTFIENAIIKARHVASITGLPALADDSGLVIDALNGAPGIYSARYAEKNNNEANINKVLVELSSIPHEQRTAHFHCSLVLMKHANDPSPLIAQANWYGYIATTRRGNAGFGYDPIFFIPSLNKTAAELNAEEKNKISHRGQALQCLIRQMSNYERTFS